MNLNLELRDGEGALRLLRAWQPGAWIGAVFKAFGPMAELVEADEAVPGAEDTFEHRPAMWLVALWKPQSLQQPFLQRWLPFWLANLVERMWLALGIILAVLLPLSRIVPPLYQFRIRSRVIRWYGQLRDIENRLYAEPAETGAALRELDALDERVGRITVPLAYADELYALRNNIDAVRRRARQGPPVAAA